MAKLKMGEMLLRAGLISDQNLRVALAQQKTHGGRLGEHLVRMHLLTEETLGRTLAQQLALEFNDLKTPVPAAIANLLPEKVSSRLQALPTRFDARINRLTVAVSNPLDEKILLEVARITGRQVVAQVAPVNLLRRAIEHAYFGVEVQDEGTNEFQLVDIHGRGKKVYVDDDAQLPELGTAEMVPLEEGYGDEDDSGMGGEHAAIPSEPRLDAPRVNPLRVSPIQPRPVPASVPDGAGEEALRTVMAIADLLIERGYFTRADLMRTLRK